MTHFAALIVQLLQAIRVTIWTRSQILSSECPPASCASFPLSEPSFLDLFPFDMKFPDAILPLTFASVLTSLSCGTAVDIARSSLTSPGVASSPSYAISTFVRPRASTSIERMTDDDRRLAAFVHSLAALSSPPPYTAPYALFSPSHTLFHPASSSTSPIHRQLHPPPRTPRPPSRPAPSSQPSPLHPFPSPHHPFFDLDFRRVSSDAGA